MKRNGIISQLVQFALSWSEREDILEQFNCAVEVDSFIASVKAGVNARANTKKIIPIDNKKKTV